MDSEPADPSPNGPAQPAVAKRPKWYRLYFALAGFDLVTILFSLWLTHRLTAIQSEAVRANQEWAGRLNRFADLAELAGRANAPGNDVFDTRNVDTESARLREALAVFDRAFDEAQRDLGPPVPATMAAPILERLGAVKRARNDMVEEAEQIFSFFRKKQPERAGERMATMDRKFAELNTAIAQGTHRIREIQAAQFQEQNAATARLKRFEALIAAAVVIMVLAASWYGHKMARTIAAAETEKERTVAELAEAWDQLEQRVGERTCQLRETNTALNREVQERQRALSDLKQAQEKLIVASRQAGMAEVATGVLHNVGNVLNSVNVASQVVTDRVRNSKIASLQRAVGLLTEHERELATYLTEHAQGRRLPEFLRQLSQHLESERTELLKEMETLSRNVDHIKEIVAMQQAYAKVSGVTEILPMAELLEDAVRMNAGALDRHSITLVREFADAPPVRVDKHKVLQILINLIRNAKYALDERSLNEKRLTLRITCSGTEQVQAHVQDNGVGIPPENLTKIFQHGFTTKRDGHGFGLHSGAIAAKEMGGALTAHSEGQGRGATFILSLPVAAQEAAKARAA